MGNAEDRHKSIEGYYGMYAGIVADRQDPLGLGRVRVSIGGLFEAPNLSPWAWPMGIQGGGAPQQGLFHPPILTAWVAIWFMLGDLNAPYYLPAHWAEGEIPTGGVVSGDDEGLYPSETKKWLVETDDRDPDILRVTNKTTGDTIEFHGVDRTFTATLKDSSIKVDGANDTALVKSKSVEVLIDGGNDKATVKAQSTEIEADGAGDIVTIKAGEIKLGAAATEALIKGNVFKTFLDSFLTTTYNGHLHPVTTAPGVTGAPTLLATSIPASNLSTVSKTE